MRKAELPYRKIEVNGGCAGRALTYVYEYFGQSARQDILATELGTTDDWGTSITSIEQHLLKRGLHAVTSQDNSWDHLKRNANDDSKMVLVDWWNDFDSQPYEDCGHYSCVDSVTDKGITLIGEGMLTRQGFESRWWDRDKDQGNVKRFILVVTKSKSPTS